MTLTPTLPRPASAPYVPGSRDGLMQGSPEPRR